MYMMLGYNIYTPILAIVRCNQIFKYRKDQKAEQTNRDHDRTVLSL